MNWKPNGWGINLCCYKIVFIDYFCSYRISKFAILSKYLYINLKCFYDVNTAINYFQRSCFVFRTAFVTSCYVLGISRFIFIALKKIRNHLWFYFERVVALKFTATICDFPPSFEKYLLIESRINLLNKF